MSIDRKSPEFLSQIPAWEAQYKNSDEQQIRYDREHWRTADAQFSPDRLVILDQAVMEDWETPYMAALAEIVTLNAGTILEVGFGLGISAKFIQRATSLSQHIVIEANAQVADRARLFGRTARHPMTVLEGFWEDVINDIPDGTLDGILFDTYPLVEEELYQNHFPFLPFAYHKLKIGGVLTYFSDEVSDFGEIHLRKLLEAGFQMASISSRLIRVQPPADCDYWKAQTIMAPIVRK